jgi:hypothetical protein
VHTTFLLEILKETDHKKRRHRWVDNIKMYLREVGFGRVDWIHLAQDKDFCERGNESCGSIKRREFLG